MPHEKQLHTASIGPEVSFDRIEAWGEALERKAPGTWSHCQRVAVFARIVARALGLDDKEIQIITNGALLHEIGKLAMAAAILQKPAALTGKERLVMRQSCSRGYEMLSKVPSFKEAAEIVYAHREWFDGSGYPRGLKEQAIPLGARVVAVADVFDVLISHRPHHAGHAFAETRTEMLRWSGRQFDPQILKVFLSIGDDAMIGPRFGLCS